MNHRSKGKEFIKKGFALIDTSNRTREIKEKSALALASKKIKITVLMKSSTKKKIFKELENKHSKKRIPAIAQSVKIYFALIEHLDSLPGVYICADGHNPSILKHYLKNLLREKYDDKKIFIKSSLKPLFGKKNIADRAAHKVARKGEKPDLELKENHFKKLKLI